MVWHKLTTTSLTLRSRFAIFVVIATVNTTMIMVMVFKKTVSTRGWKHDTCGQKWEVDENEKKLT